MPWWAWLYLLAFTLFSVSSIRDDVQERRPHIAARSLLLFGTGLAGTLAYWYATPSPPNARWLALLMLAGVVALAFDLGEIRDPQRRAALAAANPEVEEEPSVLAVAIIGVVVFLPSYIWGALFVLAGWRGQR